MSDDRRLRRSQDMILEWVPKTQEKLLQALANLTKQLASIASKFQNPECKKIVPQDTTLTSEVQKQHVQDILQRLQHDLNIPLMVECAQTLIQEQQHRQFIAASAGIGAFVVGSLLANLSGFFAWLGVLGLGSAAGVIFYQRKKSFGVWKKQLAAKLEEIRSLEIWPHANSTSLFAETIAQYQSILQQELLKNEESQKTLQGFKQKFLALDAKIKATKKISLQEKG